MDVGDDDDDDSDDVPNMSVCVLDVGRCVMVM